MNALKTCLLLMTLLYAGGNNCSTNPTDADSHEITELLQEAIARLKGKEQKSLTRPNITNLELKPATDGSLTSASFSEASRVLQRIISGLDEEVQLIVIQNLYVSPTSHTSLEVVDSFSEANQALKEVVTALQAKGKRLKILNLMINLPAVSSLRLISPTNAEPGQGLKELMSQITGGSENLTVTRLSINLPALPRLSLTTETVSALTEANKALREIMSQPGGRWDNLSLISIDMNLPALSSLQLTTPVDLEANQGLKEVISQLKGGARTIVLPGLHMNLAALSSLGIVTAIGPESVAIDQKPQQAISESGEGQKVLTLPSLSIHLSEPGRFTLDSVRLS